MQRIALFALTFPLAAAAAPPPDLAEALGHLRAQKTYSWEVINGDPGPVALTFETRRGPVTTVQQNISPHVKASVDINGDILLRRDWTDGVQLDTWVTADGAMLTRTPEGWMTPREILSAQAEERMQDGGVTPRAIWLRRADRPDMRRPDQELAQVPNYPSDSFETAGPDTYIARGRVHPDGSGTKADEEDAGATFEVVITFHLRGGVVRDYEVEINGTRRISRTRMQSVNDHKIVILTYVPVTKLDIPTEAREKMQETKAAR